MDNVHDMIKKGRHPAQKVPRFGVRPSRSKGIQDGYRKRAEAIVLMSKLGVSVRILAENFGMHTATIYKILKRSRNG